MDRITGDHFIDGPNFTLLLRHRCKLAHANAGRFKYSVQLELRGIPAQAWHLSTKDILGGDCWIKRLHPGTR